MIVRLKKKKGFEQATPPVYVDQFVVITEKVKRIDDLTGKETEIELTHKLSSDKTRIPDAVTEFTVDDSDLVKCRDLALQCMVGKKTVYVQDPKNKDKTIAKEVDDHGPLSRWLEVEGVPAKVLAHLAKK